MKNKSKTTPSILLVDDTPANLDMLIDYLDEANLKVRVATNGQMALEQTKIEKPDLILLDILMPEMDGYETCQHLKKNPDFRDIPVIFMSALTETTDKVRGLELGAVDYITKPFQKEEILARIRTHLMIRDLRQDLQAKNAELGNVNSELEKIVEARTCELSQALSQVEVLKNRLQAENVYLQEEIKLNHNFEDIITRDDKFKNILQQVEQVASTDASVLILGETGTGKELLARAVHNLSPRRERPLVIVNCAALPANLIESELFGHEKGAFTGALARKIGRFELANEGTIFLDEIGDLPLELQAKLLRILQEGEFERLGSPRTISVDVRVIAATNRNLEQEAKDSYFREDLYYRLAVFPIISPPLRERKGDIPLLVRHFVKKYGARLGKKIERIPTHIMQQLVSYKWPGNIRELENVIERAMIVSQGNQLDLSGWLTQSNGNNDGNKKLLTLEEAERQHILKILALTDWRVSGEKGAAKILGMKRTTLESRMKKLGIERR